jgi:flagella basal body P-ring formation protein FlgA
MASAASAACVPVEGDRITARDLASGNAAFSAVPPDSAIGYAPTPGARRIFSIGELNRLAKAHHLAAATPAEICFERPTEALNPDTLRAAMTSTLEATPHLSGAHLEIVAYSRFPAPKGQMEFPRAGLGSPPTLQPEAPVLWKGYILYGGARRFPIWARVRVAISRKRLIAVEGLRGGEIIHPAQVRVEDYKGFPFTAVAVSSLEQLTGRVLRRSIAAGSPVWLNLLEDEKDIKRGDVVQVNVERGAARIKLEARAESAGHKGQTIMVRNPNNGKNFTARIEGKGQVLVPDTQAPKGKVE